MWFARAKKRFSTMDSSLWCCLLQSSQSAAKTGQFFNFFFFAFLSPFSSGFFPLAVMFFQGGNGSVVYYSVTIGPFRRVEKTGRWRKIQRRFKVRLIWWCEIVKLVSAWDQTNTHLTVFMIPTQLLPSPSQRFFSLAEIRPRFALAHTFAHTHSHMLMLLPSCMQVSEICKQTWSSGRKKRERWSKLEMKE